MEQLQDGAGEGLSADRLKAFTDGVLAIALTLLILPLTDTVSDAAAYDGDAVNWIVGEHTQLFTFLLSFTLIASFWRRHHKLLSAVVYTTDRLVSLTFVWMLTIVWLPVATAVVGQFSNSPVQILIYIGTMLAANVLLLVTRLYLIRHPEVESTPTDAIRGGLASDISPTILFVVALALALAVPSVGYWAVLVLVLSRPLTAILKKMGGSPR